MGSDRLLHLNVRPSFSDRDEVDAALLHDHDVVAVPTNPFDSLGYRRLIDKFIQQYRLIHKEFGQDTSCDWILLTEDDTYCDLPLVRAVLNAKLIASRRSFYYVGGVVGHFAYGDLVQGGFVLLTNAAFSFIVDHLDVCISALGTRGFRNGHIDSWLGGCVRYAAGWANYPSRRRNASDYWRRPGMRPMPWPWPIVSSSPHALDDVVRGSLGPGPRSRHVSEWLLCASSYHKVLPADMMAMHALFERPDLQRRRERTRLRLRCHG